MKTVKIVTAGRYQKKVLYSRRHRSDKPKQRAAKNRATSAAMKALNLKNSRVQLMLRLAATFPTAGSGWVAVLTYRPGEEPKDEKAAKERVNEFRKAMRKACKAAGVPFYMINNTEHGAAGGRLHHHCVINRNKSGDFERIRVCWKLGEVEIEPLRVDREKNWETLAAYMTKEQPEKLGAHGWTATRNCPKPEVETFAVPDDTTLQAPRGAHVVSSERHSDEWANWESLAYVFGDELPKPRRKRRR